MSRISEIQALVRNGIYYLTEHADDEALEDGFDIYDIENGILTGRIRKTWPKEENSRLSEDHWTGARSELSAA